MKKKEWRKVIQVVKDYYNEITYFKGILQSLEEQEELWETRRDIMLLNYELQSNQ